jgi:hypothetical protein
MRKAIFIILIFFSSVLLFSACTSLRDSSKYEFQSAKYYTSLIPGTENKVYLNVAEDTIEVFPVKTVGDREEVETEPVEVLTENVHVHEASYGKGSHYFYNPSFDLDIITIPLKYRFATQSVPRQLTTNFNGVAYLGFRNDIFRVRYKRNPLNEMERSTRHFGTSIGGFAGISSEPVNPWVTRDIVQIEYDGVVFSTGLAWIAGINNLTAGIAIGFDFLQDPNRQHWVYQGKPWLGLAFGINLN